MPPKVNYLNNRDLLEQIHISKSSYCACNHKSDLDYDVILFSTDEIRGYHEPSLLDSTGVMYSTGQLARFERINKKSPRSYLHPSDVPSTEVVYRVMTWEHIPTVDAVQPIEEEPIFDDPYDDDEITPDELVTAPTKYVRTNFPPYIHYKVNPAGEIVIVAKSHHKGTVDACFFSTTHGKISEELAKMYMVLCQRNATKHNWRQYSYVDEMQDHALIQLIKSGLQFNEAKSNNPFSYLTTTVNRAFTHVWHSEKKAQKIRDDLLEENNMAPSYTRQGEGTDYYHDE